MAKKGEIIPKEKRTWIQTTDEQIKVALANNQGIIQDAANELGILRQTLYARLISNPELREWQLSCAEEMKDIAERKLFELVQEKNITAINIYLTKMARDRGYGDVMDLNVNSKSLNINVNLSSLTVEELRNWNELRRKVLGDATETGIIDGGDGTREEKSI